MTFLSSTDVQKATGEDVRACDHSADLLRITELSLFVISVYFAKSFPANPLPYPSHASITAQSV